ncbi:hypothetical protein CDAR_568051, partial [Caerostris darwini]
RSASQCGPALHEDETGTRLHQNSPPPQLERGPARRWRAPPIRRLKGLATVHHKAY